MQEFFYNGVKRLDWGFGNPNITAGLIATLLMAVWGLAFIHRWGFWPALVGFSALGVCLIQTASRGGLLAAILGGVVLVACLRRPWPRGRWIPIVVALVLLGSYAVWHGVATRYGKGIVEEDASVSNRWLIYRMAPAMMVDAPGGWGHKRAAEAYHHFYQPVGRVERYGSLIGSHLTWMAEWNWWGRIVYVGGWVTIFALCAPSKTQRWIGVVLAAWVAFGTAAMFTTMANRWVLWVIPAIMLLGVLGTRIALHDWPSRKRWLRIGTGTVAILAGVVLWGALVFPSQPRVRLQSGWVRLTGEEASAVWIAAPDSSVLGQAYGQRLRQQLLTADSRAIHLEWHSGELDPGSSDTVVFSGKGIAGLAGDRLTAATEAGRWILLNPDTPSQTFAVALVSLSTIQIYWGEFHVGAGRNIWKEYARIHDQAVFERVIAAGTYIPNWTDLLDHDRFAD